METKKKKPFYRRWWFILLAVIVAGSIIFSPGDSDVKIVWTDMVLGEMLPKPAGKKGQIHDNSTTELWLDISAQTDKQFADYVAACQANGFIVDVDFNSSSYRAYNTEGYKLSLGHYGTKADLSIRLEAPMEMSTISWPSGSAGQQLPIPKSTLGKFSYEHEDSFFVYIGNTSKTDYAEYVTSCSNKGFNVDYDKGENHYSADNQNGWHIYLEYVGNNVMRISIDAPNETPQSSSTDITPSVSKDTVPNNSDVVSTPDKSKETPVSSTNSDNSLDPEFKAAMDSYESFMDDYVAFMKKYKATPADLSLLTDYANYMSKYADFVEAFEDWESSDMTTAETAYYIDVQARVSKKLLEATQ